MPQEKAGPPRVAPASPPPQVRRPIAADQAGLQDPAERPGHSGRVLLERQVSQDERGQFLANGPVCGPRMPQQGQCDLHVLAAPPDVGRHPRVYRIGKGHGHHRFRVPQQQQPRGIPVQGIHPGPAADMCRVPPRQVEEEFRKMLPEGAEIADWIGPRVQRNTRLSRIRQGRKAGRRLVDPDCADVPGRQDTEPQLVLCAELPLHATTANPPFSTGHVSPRARARRP